MSEHPQTPQRKPYSTPILRAYGSVVATTRGSAGGKNDAVGTESGKVV